MGRKRTELPADVEAEIKARIERNESAETIFAAVHGALSTATIDRRKREYRNPGTKTKPSRPPAVPEAAEVPDEIPEGTPLEMIDRWIARVEKGATAAEAAGNLPALSSLAMRAASLAEARRRAVPIPKPDPNDDPDMKALGEQAEKRFFALIDDLFAPGAP